MQDDMNEIDDILTRVENNGRLGISDTITLIKMIKHMRKLLGELKGF